MWETQSEWTSTMVFVEVTVPETFSTDSETDYAALDDAVGPWGGTGSMTDGYMAGHGLFLAVFENERFGQ